MDKSSSDKDNIEIRLDENHGKDTSKDLPRPKASLLMLLILMSSSETSQ